MKRTPLTRRTPLRARTGLKRSRKPLPAKSARRTDGVLEAARRVVRARSGGRCEAGTPACPAGWHDAHHVHHTRRRRGRPDDHDPAHLLHVCAAAHLWIHDHPARSYEAGWLVRSTG